MKGKIAILTQPLGHNYGGIIQNYALQKVLSDLGHKTTTVNRIADNPNAKIKILASRIKTKLFRHIFEPKNPIHFDYNTIFAENLKFIKTHINLSPKIASTTQLFNYFKREQFRSVVVGSDQVWRPKYSPNIFNFYLDFLKKENGINKVAYAASFGTAEWEYTEEQTKVCSTLIEQFKAVSVREDSGKILCRQYLNVKHSVHVLDPTLLLSAEDYSKLIKRSHKEIGLFTYVLDNEEAKQLFIKKCAKNLGLIVSKNQAKFNLDSEKSKFLEDYVTPPLEGWLQGFRDAEFVITDSFHGTVFSIINRKPFLTLVNKERGASRFESLLKQFDLEERLVYNLNEIDETKLNSKINFNDVHLKLENLREESINFIKKQI